MAEKGDKLLEYIGDFGQFQFWNFIMICMMGVLGAESIAINFIAGMQEHWCEVDDLVELPHSQQKCVSIPLDEDGEDYDTCEYYVQNYSMYNNMELMQRNCTHYADEGLYREECTSWVYDQSQYLTTITSEWDLVCGDTWMISLTSSFWMLGYLFGTVSVGAVSDRIGRKSCYFVFLFIKLTGSFIAALAPGYWGFCVGRMIIGYGGVCFLASYILMVEAVADVYRSVLGSLYYCCSVITYSMVVWQAYLIREHVKFQFSYTLPQLLLFLLIFFLPESARWLVVNKKYKRAEEVIRKIAKINRIDLPEDLKLDTIVDFIARGGLKPNNTSAYCVLQTSGSEDIPKGTCSDILHAPRLRIRFAILCLHWFTDSLLYYALTLNTGRLPGDIYVNTFILGLVELPANLTVMFLLSWKYTGRRITCSWSLILAGIINLGIIPCLTYDMETGVTVLSMVGKFFVSMAFTGIYVWTSEVMPTEVRNIGMGSCSLFARISGIIAPFIGGPLVRIDLTWLLALYDVWLPLPNLIFAVFGLLAGITALYLPETHGIKMFETVEEADSYTGNKNTSKSAYFNDIIINEAKTEKDTNTGNFRYNGAEGEKDMDDISMDSIGKHSMEKNCTQNELKVEDTNIAGNDNPVYEGIV